MTRSLIYSIAFLLFAGIVLAPAGVWLLSSISGPGGITLAHLSALFSESRHFTLLFHTLGIAAASVALATLVGTTLAWLAVRTDLPLRRTVRALCLGPLMMPPLLHAIAWSGAGPLRGVAAAIGIFASAYYPIVTILAGAALERLDGNVLDAATLAGGSRLRRKVTLQFVRPPALAGGCAVFIFVVADFSVPDYLSSIGPKINVYADEIFSRWQRAGDAGRAVAASMPPVVLSLAMLAAAAHWRRRGLHTIGPQFRPAKPETLGAARLPALFLVGAALGISLFAPLALLASSAGSFASVMETLRTARADILQTLFVALAAAILTTGVAFVCARAVWLQRPPWRIAAEASSALTFAIPAIALAIAMIRIWNRPAPFAWIYDSCGVVVLAVAARYYIFAFAGSAGGFASIDRSLEESARLAGMGFARRLFLFIGRLALPSLAGAFLVVFVLGMRELDAIVLIPSDNRSTMFRVYNAIHFNRKEFVASLCIVHAFLTFAPIAMLALLAKRAPEVRQ